MTGYFKYIGEESDDDSIKKGDLVFVTNIENGDVRFICLYETNHLETHRLSLETFEENYAPEERGADIRRKAFLDAVTEVEKTETEVIDFSELHHLQDNIGNLLEDGSNPETGIVPTNKNTANEAGNLKKKLATVRSRMEKNQLTIRERQEKLENLLKEKALIAQARASELQKVVSVIKEGLHAISLYLGNNEDIVILRDGEPAGDDCPIEIHQNALFLDEETAVLDDNAARGGIDFSELKKFDNWVLKHPEAIQALLPSKRGIVALRPRRDEKHYHDNSTINSMMNAGNFQTYLLVKNGEKLYRILTELNVGLKLFPNKEDFERHFTQRDKNGERIPIRPGDKNYVRAMESAKAEQRRYMQMLMLLQGLIDRTDFFLPLPKAHPNLLNPDDYQDCLQFIREENTLKSGRPPFHEWIRSVNENMVVGMRVVGNFSTYATQNDRSREDRKNPRNARDPRGGVFHTISESLPDGYFKFLYARDGETIWRNGPYDDSDDGEAKRRASYKLHKGSTYYLCVDRTTPEEIEYYLHDRDSRQNYMEAIPLIKEALQCLKIEEEKEKPFRTLLGQRLISQGILPEENSESAIKELVRWWKFKVKDHRPLTGNPTEEAKALRMIEAEAANRKELQAAAAKTAAISQQTLETLKQRIPADKLLAVYQSGPYGYHTFQKTTPEIPRFYHLQEWKFPKKGEPTITKEKPWSLAPKKVESWIPLLETPAWKEEIALPPPAKKDVMSYPDILQLHEESLATFHRWQSNHKVWDLDEELFEKSVKVIATLFDFKEQSIIIYYADKTLKPGIQPDPETQHIRGIYIGRASLSYETQKGVRRALVNLGRSGHMTYRYNNASVHSKDGTGPLNWEKDCQPGKGILLSYDPQAKDEFETFIAQTEKMLETNRALAKPARKAADHVLTILEKKEHDAHKARFLEDGGIEEHWAAHWKTVKRVNYQPIAHDLEARLIRLIKAGTPYQGKTVEDIWKLTEEGTPPPKEGKERAAKIRLTGPTIQNIDNSP